MGVSTAAAFAALDARGQEGLGIREQGLGVGPLESVGTHVSAARHGAPGEGQGPRAEGPEGSGLTGGVEIDRLRELSCALAAVWMTSGVERSSSGIAGTIRPGLVSGDSPKGGALKERDVAGDLAESPILALVRTGIENDFEEVAFSQHPSLRSIKRELVGSGSSVQALYVALSGSGSALFGLYGSQADARAAQQRVQQTGVRALLTETLPRSGYWNTMFAE